MRPDFLLVFRGDAAPFGWDRGTPVGAQTRADLGAGPEGFVLRLNCVDLVAAAILPVWRVADICGLCVGCG